jgi:glycosyltransferase involved in cell wall biosynthesis
MSDRNIEFAKDYFIANDARLFKVPLWSTKTPTRTTYLKINQNVKFKVFFGGQLIAGRNIPFLITFIKHIVSKYKNYEFNIFGSGVYESEFKNLSNSHKDVIFHGKKSYDDFFIKIQDYDIGLVFTNLDTTIPSYPSKSLDMLCSGIPILGVSEESSDFSSIINNSGSGEIINANDIEILTKKLELIKFNYSQYSKNAVKFYNKSHFFKNSLKNLKNIINEIK